MTGRTKSTIREGLYFGFSFGLLMFLLNDVIEYHDFSISIKQSANFVDSIIKGAIWIAFGICSFCFASILNFTSKDIHIPGFRKADGEILLSKSRGGMFYR